MAYALSLSGLLTTFRHHFFIQQCTCACVMAERRCSAHADVEQSDGGTLSARKPRDPLSSRPKKRSSTADERKKNNEDS